MGKEYVQGRARILKLLYGKLIVILEVRFRHYAAQTRHTCIEIIYNGSMIPV